MREPKLKRKSYDIPRRLLWDARLGVKDNGGAAGPDGDDNRFHSRYRFAERSSSNCSSVRALRLRGLIHRRHAARPTSCRTEFQAKRPQSRLLLVCRTKWRRSRFADLSVVILSSNGHNVVSTIH